MSSSSDDRLKATKVLIKHLQDQYPTEGFKLSPSIDFVVQDSDNRGLCVVAKQKISKDDILVVIPEASRLTARGKIGPSFAKSLRRGFQQQQQQQQLLNMGDYKLAVAIMILLANKRNMSDIKHANPAMSNWPDMYTSLLQSATWPSEQMMKETSWFYWDVPSVRQLWNRSAMYTCFEELRTNVDATFNNIIYPMMKNNINDIIDFSLPSNNQDDATTTPKEKLYNTFIYSLSILYSRCHGSRDEGEIIPIVELFNGHSDKIDEAINKKKKGNNNKENSVINVALASGKWPFIRGSLYRDDCNLSCSAVYALRDIDMGEELIISYGNLTPTEFAYKYGVVPMDFMKHHDIMSDFCIYVSPELIPDDKLRRKCLEKAGFPLDEFKQDEKLPLANFNCRSYSVQQYMDGYESMEFIGSMRHYTIIAACQLMEDELDRNLTTGNLRGALYNPEALKRLSALFQYNIELLGGATTSAEDAEKASRSDTPSWEKCCLLARIAYRESLLMWQRAVGLKARDASFDFNEADIPSLRTGCQVCGRQYPEMKCGKCKSVGKDVQYCCRGHQVVGWKEHKSTCGK
jgi:hypothetical protein